MITIKVVSPYPLHSFGLTKFFDAVPGLHATAAINGVPAEGAGFDLAVVVADGRQAPLDLVQKEARENPVLVLGGATEPAVIQKYLRSGVFGYVDFSVALATLVSAVFAVASRRHFVSVEEFSASAPKPEVPADFSQLTARENEVLAHIAAGHTHGQVARMLGISQHTVDTYVKRVRKKLRLGNKADLTRAAMERNCLAAPAARWESLQIPRGGSDKREREAGRLCREPESTQ